MSQVVYTELEGFPVCWPYAQTRPFSRSQKLNSQNITGSAPTSESNIGLTEGSTDTDIPIYGSLEVQKFIGITSVYKVTRIFVRVKKVGSPPDSLYVRVQQDGGWLLLGSIMGSGDPANLQNLHTNRLYRITFQARFSGSGLAFTIHVWMRGSPPPLVAELRDANNNLLASGTMTEITRATVGTNLYAIAFKIHFNVPITRGENYSIILYVQNNGGNDSNCYQFVYTPNLLNLQAFFSTDGGQSWVTARAPYGIGVATYRAPTRYVDVAIPASSVGTSYTDLTITLPTAFFTSGLEYLVLRIFSPNSNSSNCYIIALRNYSTLPPDELAFRADGEMIFRIGFRLEFCIWARGVGWLCAKLFETTITLVKRIPAASPQPRIDVTFSGGTLAIFLTYGNTIEVIETTSSGTIVNKVLPPGGLKIEIYVYNGSTTITDITYLEQVYFDKNPVTPRDFGFSELYLIRVDLPAGGQIRLNDHAAGDLYSASAAMITFTEFKIPIRKAEVINGAPTLWFIGVI